VHIWGGGGVYVGDDSMIAAHTTITSVTHELRNGGLYRKTRLKKPVVIGKNVWIGSGAIILPGVTVGDNAVVGAGAVVTRNVDSNTVVAGVPSKVIRTISADVIT